MPTVGTNQLELNGLDTVTDGGADLQPWGVMHRMLVFRTDLLTDIMAIITFQQQGPTKDRLGNLYRHFGMKTALWQITDTNLIEMIYSNKGS